MIGSIADLIKIDALQNFFFNPTDVKQVSIFFGSYYPPQFSVIACPLYGITNLKNMCSCGLNAWKKMLLYNV